MKTIEEIEKAAWSYGFSEMVGSGLAGVLAKGFMAGVTYIMEDLTRWHDPKVELPETDVEVLVMVHADGHTYDVMRYDQHGWWQKVSGGGWCAAEHTPIGWRHIHEL